MTRRTLSYVDRLGVDVADVDRDGVGRSEFWNTLMDEVFGSRKGGAKVLVDAEDSKLGIGKTSAAVALARCCAHAFDYDLEPRDLTLSAAEYLERYREHPGRDQPSVLVLDELVGAGAGDARRSMSTSNVNLSRAWTLQRVKRVVTICTLPDYSEVDRRLKKLSDFRVQCLREPFGAFRSYELGTHFDGRGDIKFRRLDPGSRVFFPDMAADPLYQHLAARKDELIEASTYDADDLTDDEDDAEEDTRGGLTERQRADIKYFNDETAATQAEIAERYGIDRSWVSKIANET